MINPGEICENCNFYFPIMRGDISTNRGHCHYVPPIKHGFPSVHKDEFCSKWEGIIEQPVPLTADELQTLTNRARARERARARGEA